MRTKLHLISTPWAHPALPSAQLGCLKAYVDRKFQGRVETKTYSAHLTLLYFFQGSECFNFFSKFVYLREYIFFIIYYDQYLKKECQGTDVPSLKDICPTLRRPQQYRITPKLISELKRSIRRYVQLEIIPHLAPSALNIIGFTLNYDQYYASALIARYLVELAPRKQLLFLWGGYGAYMPNAATLMPKIGLTGYKVLGEGERKLQAILNEALSITDENLLHQRLIKIKGVVPVSDDFRSDKLVESTEQIADLSSLPVPDYDEYFDRVRSISDTDPIFAHWIKSPRLLPFMHSGLIVEGTRGCFAKCDFCSSNVCFDGFRKLPAKEILNRVRKLSCRYGIRHIRFTDNVCDTWAEPFIEEVVRSGEQYNLFFELRANHPQKFWTMLLRGGVQNVQVGIEAVSTDLLKKMKKGTTVIQNLRVQKWLYELGIGCKGNNLITHHPKSSLKDVTETKRILTSIPHFGIFRLSRFNFAAGTPLYNSLSPEDRKALQPLCSFSIDNRLRPFTVENGYEVPAEFELDPTVTAAWDEFTEWYNRILKRKPTFLRAEKLKDGRTRISASGARPTVVDGLEARILDACHQGKTLSELQRELEESTSKIEGLLNKMINKQWMINVENHYLSIPLRSKEDLLADLG